MKSELIDCKGLPDLVKAVIIFHYLSGDASSRSTAKKYVVMHATVVAVMKYEIDFHFVPK